jgi:hypothetical protein
MHLSGCHCRFVFPCYNYLVSGLSTPLFMAIPIIYVFAGLFPALLSVRGDAISWRA